MQQNLFENDNFLHEINISEIIRKVLLAHRLQTLGYHQDKSCVRLRYEINNSMYIKIKYIGCKVWQITEVSCKCNLTASYLVIFFKQLS